MTDCRSVDPRWRINQREKCIWKLFRIFFYDAIDCHAREESLETLHQHHRRKYCLLELETLRFVSKERYISYLLGSIVWEMTRYELEVDRKNIVIRVRENTPQVYVVCRMWFMLLWELAEKGYWKCKIHKKPTKPCRSCLFTTNFNQFPIFSRVLRKFQKFFPKVSFMRMWKSFE